MILQALNDYYQRKPGLPPAGFEMKEIPFVIELAKDGSVVQIEDTRTLKGKKKRARSFLVPQGAKKSVNVVANLLWGNAEYVFGLPDFKKLDESKSKNREAEYRERVKEMHAAFVGELKGLPPDSLGDTGVTAVLKFCANVPLHELTRFGGPWKEIQASNPSLTFRLHGEVDLVCQRQAVVAAVRNAADVARNEAVCLVSGESDEIERLHPPIKGVWGAQTSGANIVSFNLDAFNSWGKTQGANAPVGKRAAFAYTTALNHLLAKDSRQRIQVGDASTVFWADHPSVLEDSFADIFLEAPKHDPDRNTRALRALFEAPAQGVPPIKDEQTRFFVLGLAPNAARVEVRFWHAGTVADMSANIDRHFRDLDIVYAPFERPHLSFFRLLASTAVQGKSENIPPNLGGEVMRAVLAGQAYPETLLQGALRRIRAEREVNYPRAALVKACINRQTPNRISPEKELTVSLDLTNANPGYRLGRLFAVLEKIQEEANPGINATIRDRFYGAASAAPVTVFSNLMKLKNHHLAKLENTGRRVNFERMITEIMDSISDFPPHMDLADQGRFAIGYYHQRHALFSKSKGNN